MTTEPDRPGDDATAQAGAGAADAGAEPEQLYTEAQVAGRLAALEAQLGDRYLRLAAEYDNFMRRTAKEREEWTQRAIDAFAADLLPVLDSFDRAQALGAADPAAAASGLDVTARQLLAALGKHGVEVVDPAGAPFDPRFHEALLRTPTPSAAPGTVTAVLEKGYTLRGRLLRAARVQVASAPGEA